MSRDDVHTGRAESVREGGLVMGDDHAEVRSIMPYLQPLSLLSRKVFTARRHEWCFGVDLPGTVVRPFSVRRVQASRPEAVPLQVSRSSLAFTQPLYR